MENQIPTPTPPETSPGSNIQENPSVPITVVPKKTNSKKWLTFGLSLLFLIIAGAAVYFIYQNYQLKQQLTTLSEPIPTTVPTPTEAPVINWQYYQNDRYDYLKFKYPEGASITISSDPNPDICDLEGCFSLLLTYKDLQLDIKHPTGIGGMPHATTYPYSIVTGDYYEGVGKTIKPAVNEDTISINYFYFQHGGQQSGGFLGFTQSFTFTMPSKNRGLYEPIADIIACSVLDLEPDDKGYYSKAYIDKNNNSAIGANDDKSTYVILTGDENQGELINNLAVNNSGQYLAIKTNQDGGVVWYLYIYNLSAKNFIKIDGTIKWPASGGPFVNWLNENELLEENQSKYYKYNAKNEIRTEITAEEYSNLLKTIYPTQE